MQFAPSPLRHSLELRFFVLASVLLASLFGAGCRGGPRSFLEELDEARATTADLRLQFSRATDASNRAVMADTDEASIAFAHEAEASSRRVESDRDALGVLLHQLNYPKELQALAEFSARWSAYEELDRQILALAVENTNLKAEGLAFGPAREAADAFRAALERLAVDAAPKDRCRVEGIVNRAVLAVREIQVLQPPHIAERNEEAMTRLESEMSSRRNAAHAALGELTPLVAPSSPSLAAAATALDRFDGVSAELVALSRRNTNVRSLDLALRARPPLTAACDEGLRHLQDALAKEGSKGTR